MIIFDKDYNLHTIRPRIKVIGVGGAGGNALNLIAEQNFKHVECIAVNTDSQALFNSKVDKKIQLGERIVHGMGTGANPEIGKQAAEEDMQKIAELVTQADIVFVIAGLGGGTGSGALPVIAKILQEKNILSIALVTKPFAFEGTKRMNVAQQALEKIEEYIDTMIVIPNQKLFNNQTTDISLMGAFDQINHVMCDCIRAVADTVHNPGHINVDFADIKTTMTRMGKAIMGIGKAEGENRAFDAIENAMHSTLLEHTSLKGARSILINITGNASLSLHEVSLIASYIHDQAHPDAHIIVGTGINSGLEDTLVVTLIATGFEDQLKVRNFKQQGNHQTQNNFYKNPEMQSPYHQASQQFNYQQNSQLNEQQDNLEIPALLRKFINQNQKDQ
jgi:cell division protein FtsZ